LSDVAAPARVGLSRIDLRIYSAFCFVSDCRCVTLFGFSRGNQAVDVILPFFYTSMRLCRFKTIPGDDRNSERPSVHRARGNNFLRDTLARDFPIFYE